jgi:hypothetical protein
MNSRPPGCLRGLCAAPVRVPAAPVPLFCPAAARVAPWVAPCPAAATHVSKLLTAESVTMSPDGKFAMLDKYGYVFVAEEGEDTGELELDPTPVAHLGAGRPLGARFDDNGDLIVCDSFKVRWSTSSCSREAADGAYQKPAGVAATAVAATLATDAAGGIATPAPPAHMHCYWCCSSCQPLTPSVHIICMSHDL